MPFWPRPTRYHALPSSPLPTATQPRAGGRTSPDPTPWDAAAAGGQQLYDPPASRRRPRVGAGSPPPPPPPCRLRRGEAALVDRAAAASDDDDSDADDASPEVESAVDELRRELAGAVLGCGDGAGATGGGGEGLRPGMGCDGGGEEERKRRESLLRLYYDVDEDAVELKEGQLRFDEGLGEVVVETLFDAGLEGAGGERAGEGGEVARLGSSGRGCWWTTDGYAGESRSEAGEEDTTTLSDAGSFVVVDKPRPAEADGRTAPLTVLDSELFGLFSAEAAEWAKVDEEEASESGSDARFSSGTETSSEQSAYSVLGSVDQTELDSMMAQMGAAEEGRSTALGPGSNKTRHYGEDTSSSVEHVVVDRPSMDFLDRLGALEGANLWRSGE